MLQIIIQTLKQHLVPATWICPVFLKKTWFKEIKHRQILPENVSITETSNAYTKHIWNKSLSAMPLSAVLATLRNGMYYTTQQHSVHGSPLDKLVNPDTSPLLQHSIVNFNFHPPPPCATTLHPSKPAESELNQDLAQKGFFFFFTEKL